MPSVTTCADGDHAKPGVRWNWCTSFVLPQSSDTVSVGVLVPSVCGVFWLVKIGLHGPYDTGGRPFVGGAVLLTSRIARTRQRIGIVAPRSELKVTTSRSSARFVVVWNDFDGWMSTYSTSYPVAPCTGFQRIR